MATTKTYLIEKWEEGNGLESEISFVKPSRYDHVQVWYREEVQLGTVKAAGVDCLVFEPRPSDFDEEIALTPNTGDDWPEMARAVATEVAMFGDLLDEEVEASIAERPGIEHLPVGAYLPGHICATCLGANPCECAGGFDTRNPDLMERIFDSHSVLVGVLATFGDQRVEVRRDGITDAHGTRLDTVADANHILHEIEPLGPDSY